MVHHTPIVAPPDHALEPSRSGILISGTSLEVAHIDTQNPERVAKGCAALRPFRDAR